MNTFNPCMQYLHNGTNLCHFRSAALLRTHKKRCTARSIPPRWAEAVRANHPHRICRRAKQRGTTKEAAVSIKACAEFWRRRVPRSPRPQLIRVRVVCVRSRACARIGLCGNRPFLARNYSFRCACTDRHPRAPLHGRAPERASWSLPPATVARGSTPDVAARSNRHHAATCARNSLLRQTCTNCQGTLQVIDSNKCHRQSH